MTFHLWVLLFVLPVGINSDETVDQLSGPELAARMTIGTRGLRGADLKSDTQDVYACVGTVVTMRDYNKDTHVTWDNERSGAYRMGKGRYELKLAYTFGVDVPGINSDETVDQLSGPELAARMTIGTRGLRGADLKSDTQDVYACVGTVVTMRDYNKDTHVTWDNERSGAYRMGKGRYELKLAYTFGVDVPGQSNEFSGPELIQLMTFGTRVVRGIDWDSGRADFSTCDGAVVSEVDEDGMIRVRWKDGFTRSHHIGKDGLYELKLYSPYHPLPWLLASFHERQSRVLYTGPEMRAMMTIGSQRRRLEMEATGEEKTLEFHH